MTRLCLERRVRTASSERWSVVERNESSELIAEIADVDVHLDCKTVYKMVKGHKPNVDWSATGTIIFYRTAVDQQVRQVRDLLDGLFAFCPNRDFDIVVGAEWGITTRDEREIGPTEIRKKKGKGFQTLPEA